MIPPKFNAEMLAVCTKLTIVFYGLIYVEYNGIAFDVKSIESETLLFVVVHFDKIMYFL